jgi:hypothetical protein
MATYRGTTNETHRIQLDSAVDVVAWDRRIAAPGARVGLDIRTHFVGNGAAVEVQLRDQRGTTFTRYTEGITANRLRVEVPVPADAAEALFADVALPKHGLKTSSPPLLLTPRIDLQDLQWVKDGAEATEARRGDTLTLRATAKGAPDGLEAELTVFEHDADGAHDLVTRFPARIRREQIEAQWAFAYVEDTDDIPTDDEVESGYSHPEYFFRVDAAGVRAESGQLRFQDWIRVTVVDDFGQPAVSAEYVLHLPDGSQRQGTLDEAGALYATDLPPGPVRVECPDAWGPDMVSPDAEEAALSAPDA